MKKLVFILFIIFSISSFGQSVVISGKLSLVENNDFNNVKPSDNYAIITINKSYRYIHTSINGTLTKWNIENSSLTDGGRQIKFTLSDQKGQISNTIISMMELDNGKHVIILPLGPNVFGVLMSKLTYDDKRNLGFN